MCHIDCIRGEYAYTLTYTLRYPRSACQTVSYGLAIYYDARVAAAVYDITDDYDEVQELFELIVEHELYPEHLPDVVEDYLASRNTENINFNKYTETDPSA